MINTCFLSAGWSRGLLLCLMLCALTACERAQDTPRLSLASSIYVGWMPWFLAAQDGTLARHAKANEVQIDFVRGDYIETINQFAAGGVDAVTLTNIDALALLAASGIAADVILIGSYSQGNDAVLLRPERTQPLDGKTLGLVEYSVSHYLLDRCLQRAGLPLNAVNWLNIADSEIAAAFAAPGSRLDGVVTWNPIAGRIEQDMQGQRICDSADIPREIADMLVVRRDTLAQRPGFARALLATWFEISARMQGEQAGATLQRLGELSGADAQAYRAQLNTTEWIGQPAQALRALQDEKLPDVMRRVRDFVQRHPVVRTSGQTGQLSYGAQPPAGIHFNPEPLARFKQDTGN